MHSYLITFQMSYNLSDVKVSDADSIARHVEVPAMQNAPLYRTMFPQASTMTAAQKSEVIAWYSDMLTDAFENGAESFLKVWSADGSPVGFCGWTVIEQTGEEKTMMNKRPEQGSQKSTWLPETLDQDGWINLSRALRTERDRVLKDVGDATRLTFMAVRPEHQRQGVGSMMMQQFCKEADLSGRCAYVLAAPEGVRLYAKFGFEIVGCVESMQGNITSMLRRPREP
ncbi:acyl-CoA N-acyltransferase [Trichoderma gracile]